MSKKKKLLIIVAVVLAVATVSGVSILAATTFGSQTDPLVTLSYLTEKYKPQIIEELKKDIASAAEELSRQLEAKVNEANATPGASQPTTQIGDADVFKVVTLTQGKTINCAVGAEIMLRVGTAEGMGSAPALVNTTTGATIAAGSALETNHMYMVTIEGNGIKATAETVRVLIRGSYTIS